MALGAAKESEGKQMGGSRNVKTIECPVCLLFSFFLCREKTG